MVQSEQITLRHRQVNALAWRVAGELARRDRSLYIGLTGEGGSAAYADALMLTSPNGTEYQARRTGLGFTAGLGGQFQIDWARAFEMSSARAIALALENSLNIHFPESSPSTTPRALGYRVMASILEMSVSDSKAWFTIERRGGPLRSGSASDFSRLLPYEDTRWVLQRDTVEVAVFDNFGWVQINNRTMDLYERYRELDGRLASLVVDIFHAHVP